MVQGKPAHHKYVTLSLTVWAEDCWIISSIGLEDVLTRTVPSYSLAEVVKFKQPKFASNPALRQRRETWK